jgi:hypothetical protein
MASMDNEYLQKEEERQKIEREKKKKTEDESAHLKAKQQRPHTPQPKPQQPHHDGRTHIGTSGSSRFCLAMVTRSTKGTPFTNETGP